MLRIKEICKEKGISLEKLANDLNIGYQSLHSAMTGNPQLKTLEKIASTLGVSINELFEPCQENAIIKCPHCGNEIKIKVD